MLPHICFKGSQILELHLGRLDTQTAGKKKKQTEHSKRATQEIGEDETSKKCLESRKNQPEVSFVSNLTLRNFKLKVSLFSSFSGWPTSVCRLALVAGAVSARNLTKPQTRFFFLLVAACVSPGRSSLQSAEHWCQRRNGQIHLVMCSSLIQQNQVKSSLLCNFVAQVVKKRALVKSQRKAPTPEREGQVEG